MREIDDHQPSGGADEGLQVLEGKLQPPLLIRVLAEAPELHLTPQAPAVSKGQS